jgi:iron(III) transport system permease protein
VVLPLIRPGLFAGGIVVAVWSFTDVGTPLMLGFDRTTPVQILNGILELEGDRTPFALVVVMLVLAGGAYLVAHQVFARRHDALVTKTAQAASPRRLGVGGTALAWLVFGAVIAVAAAPNLAVVLIAVSREWYATVLPTALTLDHLRLALAHELVVPGVVNSLQYAAAATVLALVLGTFIAWTSARWRPVGWQALDLMAMLPLAIPGIVLAFGYFSMATRLPWLKAWLDPVVWPVPLLIIAYAVRRLPFVVRSVHAGFQQVPLAYEEAASALGAGPACRLRRIVLPLLLGSLAAGAILTFSYSMLEVSDSLVLAQKRAFFPVTRVLFELTGILGGGAAVACAFALWAMAFLAATLAAAAAFLGKDVSGLLRD